MKRWTNVGLVALFGLLAVSILGGIALAQGPWQQTPGRGYGYSGYGYGGWGCDGWGARMMGRPAARGWGGNRGWGMWNRPWGYYSQQPGAQGSYTPESLPDNGDAPKSREEVSFQNDMTPLKLREREV